MKTRDLHELLSKFGKIFSCRVKYDNAGVCKGFGFIQFEARESAEKAIAEGNGLELKGNKIELVMCKSKENKADNATAHENNLFVRGIPTKFTNEDLVNLFKTYGEIVSGNVIKERPDSIENKGYGFICFKHNTDKINAEKALNGTLLDGQQLFLSSALIKESSKKFSHEERLKMYKDCNVYVKSLPEEITDEKLKTAFEEYGPVASARVMIERIYNPITNQVQIKSLGFGFVCFTTPENARKAIEGVATKQIFGQKLYAGIAEKREDRIARFTTEYIPQPMQPPVPYYAAPPQYGPRNIRARAPNVGHALL